MWDFGGRDHVKDHLYAKEGDFKTEDSGETWVVEWRKNRILFKPASNKGL